MRNEKVKKPFYKRWWFIALLVLVVIGSISSCSDNNDNNDEMALNKESETNRDIDYEIVEKDDISTGVATRFTLGVVVKEEVTAKELESLSEEIVESFKDEEDFNALSIGYYDYEEFVGHGYSLGQSLYAPKGDIGKADTVKAGDYKKMEFAHDTMEKNWDNQLTQQQAKVVDSWNELYYGQATAEYIPEEDDVDIEIAEQFDMTPEEVNEILSKYGSWIFEDTNK